VPWTEPRHPTSPGAVEVIDRAALSARGKPLQKERWAGVVDSVGSHTLADAAARTRYGGTVTACRLAQGMDFPAPVAPFILRSVRLIGIHSVIPPAAAGGRTGASGEPTGHRQIGGDCAGNRIGRGNRPAPELLAGKVRG
jgi:acrylyl-CoA reductase (NADPH)